MALIACPECEKEVSDKAPTCPNCGAPIAAHAPSEPQCVKTTEDSFVTRNRSCGDLLIYGTLLIIALPILVALCAHKRQVSPLC